VVGAQVDEGVGDACVDEDLEEYAGGSEHHRCCLSGWCGGGQEVGNVGSRNKAGPLLLLLVASKPNEMDWTDSPVNTVASSSSPIQPAPAVASLLRLQDLLTRLLTAADSRPTRRKTPASANVGACDGCRKVGRFCGGDRAVRADVVDAGQE
jgi:hypothetical protein